MSLVADLVESYQRGVALPWSGVVAHRQRVWMAVYPPDQERRLRVHIGEFELATTKARLTAQLDAVERDLRALVGV